MEKPIYKGVKSGRVQEELFCHLDMSSIGCGMGTLSAAKCGFHPRRPSHFTENSCMLDWLTCLVTAGEGAGDTGKRGERGQDSLRLRVYSHFFFSHLNVLETWDGTVASW